MAELISSIEEYLARDAQSKQGLAELTALYTRDYHTCDCPWPHIERAWGGAVGTFREIRLCCMARALEKLLGLPEGAFYWTAQFTPLFAWDENEIVEVKELTGNVSYIKRGPPPQWMQERMARKGIPWQRT